MVAIFIKIIVANKKCPMSVKKCLSLSLSLFKVSNEDATASNSAVSIASFALILLYLLSTRTHLARFLLRSFARYHFPVSTTGHYNRI